jgi:hypothetical protein
MKRVRITIDPGGIPLPPVYEAIADGPHVADARIVNWNVSEPPTGFLLWLRGDPEGFEAYMAGDDDVASYEVLPIADDAFHCFLEGDVPAASRALFENFTRGSLMTVPPVEIHDGGASTFTIFGTEADIQAAVEGVPDGVAVDVEAVGGRGVAQASAVGRLSDRQRAAVEAALELGYYDVPRAATTDDVARELDCAPATAAEHLQKAESRVLAALFEG